LPDLGLMTMDEVVGATRRLVRATGLPVIVDGDTGFGETLNVMRLVVELEQAGAAALQIEDQEIPKKCGHLPMKRLSPANDMARKVEAAKRARRDLLVIARTDAAPEDVDDAFRRAKLYEEAGADIIFAEALVEDDHFRRFARGLKVPLLANMTEFGKTPYRSARDFEALGAKIVLWPVTSLRIAAKAIEALYQHLALHGEQQSLLDRMQTRASLAETLGYAGYEALDRAIAEASPRC
jgi:methylisocitrate lyase